MMIAYLMRGLGMHRGAPRLYLDSAFLLQTQFQPGRAYSVAIRPGQLVLFLAQEGDRLNEGRSVRRVSSKSRGGQIRQAVIDLNSKSLLSSFIKVGTVQITVYSDRIEISIPASEQARHNRLQRLMQALERGHPLSVASTAHGVGVLSHALHTGLEASGWKTRCSFANEIDEEFLATAHLNNDSWDSRTVAVGAPIQELVQDSKALKALGQVDVLEAGLPCSGASKAGKAKRGLEMMESHPVIGHLVVPTIMLIQQMQPICVLAENVVDYANTASAELLRKALRDMGYSVTEICLQARDFDTLEERKRWFFLAMTRGIRLQLEQVSPIAFQGALSDVLEEIPADSSAWGSFQHLAEKEDRDRAAGKGFAMQIVSPDSESVPTLRKGYAKCGSTDPLLRHPETGLLRCFTVAEHARIKGVPEHLTGGLSHTRGHQALGQSVAYKPVFWLSKQIGSALKAFATHKVAEGTLEASTNLAVTG